jgi:hypothetical protein
MGDVDAFAAFAAMVLVTEGDNAMLVLKPDRAVALRRDAVRLRSSSKKTRRSASLPRFGVNLRLRLARHLCGIMIPHKTTNR